jgi:DNA replicative helicase MCM subunit Mcm2 (Cdc46/Mcm family)
MTVQSRTVENQHLVVVGQMTPSAFRSGVDNLSLANGFMNRFIPILVARPHLIPWPGETSKRSRDLLGDLIHRCAHAPKGILRLSPKARRIYEQWYLTREKRREHLPEKVAQLTARGNANVIRLAVIYALLQGSLTIRTQEIRAAIAIIEYADASANFLLATGKVGLEAKITKILESKSPLSRDELHRALGGHNTKEELNRALNALEEAGIIKTTTEQTRGRPRNLIELVTPMREKREKVGK